MHSSATSSHNTQSHNVVVDHNSTLITWKTLINLILIIYNRLPSKYGKYEKQNINRKQIIHTYSSIHVDPLFNEVAFGVL